MPRLVPLEVKLARYHAWKRKKIRRRRKKRAKAKLKALLAMARAALGYKKPGVRKLSASHLKARREGHQRYYQALREKKFSNTGSK